MAENERDEQGQPMTAAELAAIRERADSTTAISAGWEETKQAFYDRHDLLADATYWRGKVEQAAARMREMEDEHARLLDIVRAVANGPRWIFIPPFYICNFCNVEVAGLFGRTDHRADCPVTKARAVLAAAASQAAQTEAEA